MGERIPIEIKGLGKSLLLALLLGTLISVVVYYTGLKETLLSPLAKLVLVISVFSGGCYVSKAHGNKGLVRGVSLGIMFFTLMLIATLAFNSSLIDLKGFLYTLGVCIVSGGIGGILGIGLSNN